MKIYIDHFINQDDFVINLTKRIRAIDSEINVTSMLELRDKPNSKDDDADLIAIKNSDIIIPIITADYLSINTDFLEDELERVSSLEAKTIFPIIYEETNWSSREWIVKSKIFPSSGEVYNEIDKNQQSKVINELIQTISDMVAKKKRSQNQKPSDSNIKLDFSNQIFISHSHHDADFAELLQLHLEKNEIICWRDDMRLKIGQDWREEIDSGISQSKAMIVIMSPEARKSEYVTYEWAYAWGKEIKVLPIMLTQTALHPRLESLQYLDFTNRITRPYDELIERIKEIR